MNKILYKNKYDFILPFGSMCSISLLLRDNGFRSKSSFFDWITSNFFGNIELVNNSFLDCFNKDFLVQNFKEQPQLITNTKYNFTYTHIFNPKETFDRQKNCVKKHIDKTIDNFYSCIKSDALLIYYCRDKKEQDKIIESIDVILSFCSKHKVDFAFIFNNPVENFFPFFYVVTEYNNKHHPFEDSVSYPLEGPEIDKLLKWLECKFDETKRKSNLKYKHKDSLVIRIKRKLQSKQKNRLLL